MIARAVAGGLAVVLAACVGSAELHKIEGDGRIGWEVVDPSIPKGIDLPIVDGGLVLNSYRDEGRAVVTIVYAPADRGRLERVYDEWLATRDGEKSGRGFDVLGRVAWQDSWRAGLSEARMTECLSERSGEFDNLCVALTTWVGSVP